MRPVDKYGFLRVEGGRLVGENGSGCRLFGMSTHGLAWRPEYVCFDTFKYLRDEWHTNAVRLAMYTHEFHGYCTDGDKKYLFSLMKKGIDLAIELGIYVIVDWHVLGEFSPLIYADEAERFFREITEYYGDCPNIIYEICNEPNGSCGWEEIREYAGWLGDFVVMAGEFEMEALAAAALRAEQGTEPVKHYTGRSVFAGLEEKS